MEERSRIPVGLPVLNPLPSYWHSPKSSISSFASATTLPSQCDFLIIGSGISGALIAYNLLEAFPGASIVMLEAREACGGATGRNGGHTKAASYRTYLQQREELGKEEALKIARLEYANILETHRLAEALAVECESHICNTVDVVYDQETFERGKKAIEVLRKDATEEERREGGLAWYKIYSPEEAKEKFFVGDANENTEVKGPEKLAGAFEYLAGRISGYHFATGILEICVQRGLKLWTQTPVQGIDSAFVDTEGSLPPYDVTTLKGKIRATSVIHATNGYAAHLLPLKLQGSVVPLRGQITAQRSGSAAKLPVPLPTTYSFIYRDGYEYMIPRPLSEGYQHIVIGGGLGRLPEAGTSEYGTIDDGVLQPQVSKYLKGAVAGYFREDFWGEQSARESENRIVQEWTGIMGATADGRPLVGEVPRMKGTWISAGFNGHGMVLCLKSAEALVRMIQHGNTAALEQFPSSFIITNKRMGIKFSGRTDMKVPETRGEVVEKGKL